MSNQAALGGLAGIGQGFGGNGGFGALLGNLGGGTSNFLDQFLQGSDVRAGTRDTAFGDFGLGPVSFPGTSLIDLEDQQFFGN